MNSRDDEQRLKLSTRLVKKYVDNIYSKDSLQYLYKNLLTKHGFKKILEEFESRNPLTISPTKNEDTFNGFCGENPVIVTSEECVCNFYLTYRLPCRHIFNVRDKLGLNLYQEEICNPEYIYSKDIGRQPVWSNLNFSYDNLDDVLLPSTPKAQLKKSCKIQATPKDTSSNLYPQMEQPIQDLWNIGSEDNSPAKQLREMVLELRRLSRLVYFFNLHRKNYSRDYSREKSRDHPCENSRADKRIKLVSDMFFFCTFP